MKHTIFINILLLIGVVCLFSCYNGDRTIQSDSAKTHAEYDINYYVDTIYGHVILSTVVNSKNSNANVSVSTIEIEDFSKIDND